ncbi:MAG: SseB family protein [Myxococcota bacterium]
MEKRARRGVVKAHVAALREERFLEYRCVVQAGLSRVYLSQRASEPVRVRLPADFMFDPYLDVRSSAPEKLKQEGFSLEAGASGLEWVRAARDPVRDTETLLFDVLGFAPETIYSVAVEPDRPADNESLRDAMRDLAKTRSHDARRAVYQNLLDATMLLAVDRGEGAITARVDPESLGGRPTWLAFSGASPVGDHAEVTDFVSISGLRLMQAALGQRIGALRLDYGSTVGGELYANELESIGESVPAARPPRLPILS